MTVANPADDAGDRIDELVGRCLVQVLDPSGHALYLRHPISRESLLVGFSSSSAVAAETRRQLHRIVLALVYEGLAEGRR